MGQVAAKPSISVQRAAIRQYWTLLRRRTVRYEQVAKLLVERNSQRSIVRATGVARMTIAKLAKKSASQLRTSPSTNE